MKKSIFLLFWTTFTTQVSLAQDTYIKTFGGPASDWALDAVRTNDHGTAFAGSTWSYGDNFFLGKLDASGTPQWSRVIGGPSIDRCTSLASSRDGGYFLGGTTMSFRAVLGDVLVTKINPSGDLEWSRTIGGALGDWATSVIQTTDDGFAVAGSTESFGTGETYTDIFLAKLNSLGAVEWTRKYHQLGYEVANDMIQTSDEGFLLAGFVQRAYYSDAINAEGRVLQTPTSIRIEEPYTDILLVKLDPTGNIQWSKTLGGDYSDFAYSVAESKDGYVVCGSTTSFGAGGSDLYVAQLHHDGSLAWTRTIGGERGEAGYSICLTGDGGYAACGYTNTYGSGHDDMYLVKLTATGAYEWSTVIGGTDIDQAKNILQNADGGYALTGWTGSFGTGDRDICLVKTDPRGLLCDHSSEMPSVTGTGGVLGDYLLQYQQIRPAIRKANPSVFKGGLQHEICHVR